MQSPLVRLIALAPVVASLGSGACRAQSPADATPPAFQPAGMATYSDSFVTVIRGVPGGWHRYAVEPTSAGWRFSEAFAVGDQMSRSLEVSLDSSLRVRTSAAQGQMLGQPVGARLTYDGQRVRGRAFVRRGANKAEVSVDTTLPPEAFDGLALMGLLPTLDWHPGALYRLVLFDAEEGSVTEQLLRISGPEQLEVPAGTFDALRGELTTTQAPVRIWVTRSKPHRVLKIGGETDDVMTMLVSSRAGPVRP